jgi:hypothetical protein
MSDELTAPSNPFGASAPPPPAALVATESSRAVMEVQAAMMIAQRFPRDQVKAMDRILQACTRPSLADSALYEYARGGTAITGPSIRMAEMLAQNWGNMQFGIRELEQRPGESTVEAFAWDIETNTRQVKVFQVPHERHTRQGKYALTDPRDIYELVANQGARRLRACILGVIPGDVIESAVKQCEVTLTTKVELTPERIKKMVETFAGYGVTTEQIEKRIQRRIEAITPALFVQLGKIANSLRDGMSKPAEWFPVEVATDAPTTAHQAASVKDKVKAKLAKDRINPADVPDAGAPPSDPPTDAPGVFDD